MALTMTKLATCHKKNKNSKPLERCQDIWYVLKTFLKTT